MVAYLRLSGTGKTSVARKMGKVYYDMGFLASDEVIDCSASDLVGQYVGHTGPKVRDQFDKALGKVSLSQRHMRFSLILHTLLGPFHR